jgi:PIN domain nuclease of toxin-antitoxin system
MRKAVLDASAVLAYVGGEPGGEMLEEYRDAPLISAVNLAEVLSTLVDRGLSIDVAASVIDSLGLTVSPFDEDQALQCASLRSATKPLGLSLGDRACLALAASSGRPALTADKSWSRLETAIAIRSMR